MKKFIAILLTALMVMAMFTTAFAAEGSAAAGERTYVGYELLDLTTSLKTGTHHPAGCDNINHTSDCYNYAYTVKEKYRAVLQAEAFGNAGNSVWAPGVKPADESGVTDEQILKYLANQTGDNGTEFKTMRGVADRIYRAIQAAKIKADTNEMQSDNIEVNKGYWLFADVSKFEGAEANSLVVVVTADGKITITPKSAIPTIEKKVKDIKDSEDDKIGDNEWHDSADHDIGDPVPFKLTGTLPENAQYYQSYKMVFHDTLSEGLTLNADSIKVYMYNTKGLADDDDDMNDGVDVTEKFVVNATTTDGCTFEVGCENVYTIDNTTANTVFVVYYEATLNEKAAIGEAGNPNEAFLEFSNDPYGDGTGNTEEDVVKVFTFKLVINKTDSHGHALEGAGFTLSKRDLNGNWNTIGGEKKGKGMTTFTWEGLDDGLYKLEETTVPAGYNKMLDVTFTISATHSSEATNPVLLTLDGGSMGTGVVATGAITKEVVNNTGTILPETGARGTVMLIGVSSMVVLMAAVFMITRKKMSVYED